MIPVPLHCDRSPVSKFPLQTMSAQAAVEATRVASTIESGFKFTFLLRRKRRPTGTGRSVANEEGDSGAILQLSSSGNFDPSGLSESSHSTRGSTLRYRSSQAFVATENISALRGLLSERASGDSPLCEHRRLSVKY